LPQIEANLVKAIATTGQRRSASSPKVPTAQEQGLNFEVNSWQGLFLPQGTPQPIVRRLTQAIGETLDTRSVRDRFEAIGEGIIHPSGEAQNILPSSLSRKSRNGLPPLGKVGWVLNEKFWSSSYRSSITLDPEPMIKARRFLLPKPAR
jgi:Tripartite tricarboxylate transporter family receptor